jgi:hypothetical protein
MGRSGYTDDFDGEELVYGRWRGRVASAIRGKRGQQLLRDTLAALDAMPDKRLIDEELRQDGEVCTLGAVLVAKGADVDNLDPEAHDQLGSILNVPECLIQEIEYENDEGGYNETPEKRWERMRRWVVSKIKPDTA